MILLKFQNPDLLLDSNFQPTTRRQNILLKYINVLKDIVSPFTMPFLVVPCLHFLGGREKMDLGLFEIMIILLFIAFLFLQSHPTNSKEILISRNSIIFLISQFLNCEKIYFWFGFDV